MASFDPAGITASWNALYDLPPPDYGRSPWCEKWQEARKAAFAIERRVQLKRASLRTLGLDEKGCKWVTVQCAGFPIAWLEIERCSAMRESIKAFELATQRYVEAINRFENGAGIPGRFGSQEYCRLLGMIAEQDQCESRQQAARNLQGPFIPPVCEDLAPTLAELVTSISNDMILDADLSQPYLAREMMQTPGGQVARTKRSGAIHWVIRCIATLDESKLHARGFNEAAAGLSNALIDEDGPSKAKEEVTSQEVANVKKRLLEPNEP